MYLYSELFNGSNWLEGHRGFSVDGLGELHHFFALLNTDIIDRDGVTLEESGHKSVSNAGSPLVVGLF
jgi:hypothetical protein